MPQNNTTNYIANPVLPQNTPNMLVNPNSGPSSFNTVPSVGNPSINNTNLPTIPKTPPSTVTVGTSNLANQNFNVQQAGFNQLDQNVQQHAQAKAGANPQVSIVDLLESKGQPSDYASRAKLAAKYGIQNYTGSATQNMQLINLVNQGQQPQGQTTTTQTQGKPQVVSPTMTSGTENSNITQTPEGTTQVQSNGNQTYEQQVNDVTNQFQNLIDQHMKDLNSIRNGTFPLSSYEQAQLDATQKNLDRAREMQLTANANYEKAVTNAQFRTGTNLTDPQQFLAKNQQVISDDISKISALDNQAALTMNQLRQSFMDKDYKMINDQYTELKDLLKQKSDTIDKVQKRSDDMARDLRDYNLKVQEFQLQKEKTYAEISKIRKEMQTTGSTSLGNGTFAKNVKTALSGIRFPSVADRKEAESTLAGLIADGDFKGAQSQLNQYAFNSMTTDEQQKLAGKDDAIKALDRIEVGLDKLKEKGISTNFLTGLKQKSLEKGGFLADPEANAVAEDIALAIVDYRKAVSGAAFTESEAKQYETLFPSIGNTPALNSVKIDTLKNKFNNDIVNAYSRRIPKYKDISDSLIDVSEQTKVVVSDIAKQHPDEFRSAITNYFNTKGTMPTIEDQQQIAEYISQNSKK